MKFLLSLSLFHQNHDFVFGFDQEAAAAAATTAQFVRQSH